jgi:hypothetical protein
LAGQIKRLESMSQSGLAVLKQLKQDSKIPGGGG